MSERPDEFELKPRQVARKQYIKKKVRPTNCMDLAYYFCSQVPGTQNVQALAGAFARWKRDDGLTIEKIRAMIDLYAPVHQPGTSAWRSFIYNRDRLAHEADNKPKQRGRDDPIFKAGRRN